MNTTFIRTLNFAFLIILLTLGSCAAHFDRYPGEKLNAFPEEMRGNYFEHNKSWLHYLFTKDTAQISIGRDSILLFSEKTPAPVILGDSVVFSRFGNYYALSQLDSRKPDSWSITIIRITKNDFESYPIEENKPYSENLLQLFTSDAFVKNGDASRKPIVIPKETKLRIMHNGNDTSVIFKMNEESMNIFFDKYLSKEPHSHFKRIK